MSGSCKLLFVILYFLYAQNLVIGHPRPSDDDDGPPGPPAEGEVVPISGKTNNPEDILKLNAKNPGKDVEDEPPPTKDDDEKAEPNEDEANEKPKEKNDEEAKNDGDDENVTKKLNEKDQSLFKEQNFMNEDDAASLHWPLGIVPYYLDSSVFDFIVAYNLRKAMDLIESVSCVRFKTLMLMPSEGQNLTWINITNPKKERECSHEPEEGEDGQIVMVLGFDCMKQKQILHTLLHAIGFKDEVTHPLRDQYIHILWDNIQQQYLHLFRSVPSEVTVRTNFEYDPASIMHFHDRAFSRNGQATLQALLPGLQIGPSDTLSALDKLKLRLMFGRECNKRNVIGLQESCKNVMSKDQKLKVPNDDPRDIEALKTHDALPADGDAIFDGAERERWWGKPSRGTRMTSKKSSRPKKDDENKSKTSKKPKKPKHDPKLKEEQEKKIQNLLEDDKLRTSEEN